MKLFEIKQVLSDLKSVNFKLPDGSLVPRHFHVTEVGKVVKHFIDCGGTERIEEVVNFQLWNANDYDHRLHPEKLLNIIELSERVLRLNNSEIEVEYQGETIQKFGLEFEGKGFLLTSKQTDCLAKEQCGIPKKKPRVRISSGKAQPSCSPDSGCC